MKKAYKYRIYPTKKQAQLLNEQLALCADLYNAALQERRDAYKLCGKSISFTQQSAQLPDIKAIRPEYEAIYSQILQDVLHRVDKAFQAFFRRVKARQQPGYPRFKSRLRYDSLTYPQSGFAIDEQGKLWLSKIGHIKLVLHRPTKGVVKTCSIMSSATGKWYVVFSCDEIEPTIFCLLRRSRLVLMSASRCLPISPLASTSTIPASFCKVTRDTIPIGIVSLADPNFETSSVDEKTTALTTT